MVGKLKGLLICLIVVAQFAGALCEFHSELSPAESAAAVIGDSESESHHGSLDCNVQSPSQYVVASASLATVKCFLQIGTPAFDKADIGTGPFAGVLARHPHGNIDLSSRLEFSILRI